MGRRPPLIVAGERRHSAAYAECRTCVLVPPYVTRQKKVVMCNADVYLILLSLEEIDSSVYNKFTIYAWLFSVN